MQTEPIDLYYWPTPNGVKVAIMLEETGLPYTVRPVDITRGDQFEPAFLRISPNNKMPAIVDPEGPDGREISLFESGAILLYLAEKTGHFMPREPRAYWRAMQWLMFQMGGVGPMLGQTHHFRLYAPERLEYGIDRYTNEAKRLYCVLDRRLGESDYIAGDEYTIVDMATWPWIRRYDRQGQDLGDFPNVQRWFETVALRPAVQKGIELLADESQRGRKGEGFDEEAREVLFGSKQYERR
jgi:GSH-dependent disulfide-bond oxidoreductase